MNSKSKIAVISMALLLLAGVECRAQIKFGLETGLGFTSTTQSPDDAPLKKGFFGAMNFEFYLARDFSVQTGVQYVQKGCKTDNGIVTVTHKEDYIAFPFILKVIFPIKRFSLFITSGAYYGFGLSTKQEQSYSTGEQYSYDVSDLYSGKDVGITYGGGVSFKVSKITELTLEVSRAVSTSNITEFPGMEGFNRGTLLTAGIRFRISK